MLKLAITFFIISIIAAVFGFGGVAGASASIATMLFWVFAALFLISLVLGIISGRKIQ